LSKGAEEFLSQKIKSSEKKKNEVVQEFFSTERSQSLLQRFTSPEEIAQTIVYLCSPLSSATNGAIIKSEGGSTSGVF
jgi:NAD(P)-dependent dehydrogenase (short-subunit alcohol dehydrogenase family)